MIEDILSEKRINVYKIRNNIYASINGDSGNYITKPGAYSIKLSKDDNEIYNLLKHGVRPESLCEKLFDDKEVVITAKDKKLTLECVKEGKIDENNFEPSVYRVTMHEKIAYPNGKKIWEETGSKDIFIGSIYESELSEEFKKGLGDFKKGIMHSNGLFIYEEAPMFILGKKFYLCDKKFEDYFRKNLNISKEDNISINSYKIYGSDIDKFYLVLEAKEKINNDFKKKYAIIKCAVDNGDIRVKKLRYIPVSEDKQKFVDLLLNTESSVYFENQFRDIFDKSYYKGRTKWTDGKNEAVLLHEKGDIDTLTPSSYKVKIGEVPSEHSKRRIRRRVSTFEIPYESAVYIMNHNNELNFNDIKTLALEGYDTYLEKKIKWT